ncbi:hypothetical protein V6N13_125646 [Hibiscus sabdariffa]
MARLGAGAGDDSRGVREEAVRWSCLGTNGGPAWEQTVVVGSGSSGGRPRCNHVAASDQVSATARRVLSTREPKCRAWKLASRGWESDGWRV